MSPVGSNITVTFSEPVNVTSSSFTLVCGTSGTHTVTVSGTSPVDDRSRRGLRLQ